MLILALNVLCVPNYYTQIIKHKKGNWISGMVACKYKSKMQQYKTEKQKYITCYKETKMTT